jgi:hypothetical protein
MQKVLAAAYHTGSATPIIPVIRKLKEQGLEVEVLAQTAPLSPAADEFTKAGIPFTAVPVPTPYELMQHVEAFNPYLILTGTSEQDEKTPFVIEQTLAEISGRWNIPSLAVLDVWNSYSSRFAHRWIAGTFRPAEQIQMVFMPTRLAVMDDYAKQDLVQVGFPVDRIEITGNPFFDNLPEKARTFPEEKRTQIRKQIFGDRALAVFYAANAFVRDAHLKGYSDLTNLPIMDETINALLEKGNISLAMRLHPRAPTEDVQGVEKYLKEQKSGALSKIAIHPRDLGSQDIALASDLVITPWSTLGIEAVYMSKPCISLQPGLKDQDGLVVSAKGVIPVGYIEGDCRKVLHRALTDKEYRTNGMAEQASRFRTDGRATERVVGLVNIMLS